MMSSHSQSTPPRQSPTPAGVPSDPDFPEATPRDKEDKHVDKRKAPENDGSDMDTSADITSFESPMKKPRTDSYPVMSPLCAGDDSPSKYPPQGGITDVPMSLGVISEDQLLRDDSSDNNGVQIGAESDVNLSTSVEEAVTIPEPMKGPEENTVEPPKVEESPVPVQVEGLSVKTEEPPMEVDDTSHTSLKTEDSSVKVVKEAKSESDSDSGSKFFAHIRHEQQKHKHEKGSSTEREQSIQKVVDERAPRGASSEGTTGSSSSGSQSKKKSDKGKGESSRRGKTDSSKSRKNSSHSNSGGSANYSSSMDISSMSPHPVEYSIQVYDGKTKSLMYETKNRLNKCDYETMKTFLKASQVELPSFVSTGYSADVSSPESGTFDFLNTPQKPRTTSLGSSIPRPSDASAISRPSIIGVQDPKKLPVKQPSRPPRKQGDMEPILSSTRITEYKTSKPKNKSSSDNSTKKAKVDKAQDTGKTPVTNGGDHTSTGKSNQPAEKGRGLGRRKAVSSTPVSVSVAKTPVPHPPAEESTPKRSAKSAKAVKIDTSISADKSALMFSDVSDIPNLSALTNVTPSSQSEELSATASSSASTSEFDPDVSKKIKREPVDSKEGQSSKGGSSRKAIGAAKGQVEKFNDPGFVQSATLWGAIQVDEPVFARWRDKSYYSGRITKKGLNDTWYIHFEDDMEDVASEAHILPIKILGRGTRTVYCPSDCFKPEEVIVVGQRFVDPVEKVEYAVVSDVDGRRINCFRRNLILKETDAKELRKEYQVPSTNNIKRTDLNLDNIVTGPRRRAGVGPPAPSDQIRKLIADAFDASSADEHLLAPWTPTPTPKKTSGQGGRRGSGTSGTESNASDDTRKSESKTIPSTVTETPEPKLQKTPSVNVSATATAAKDTPKSVGKESAKKIAKGKEKPLFHGMQFFLTASGGGDPSSSGTSGPLVTYDKDEYRETIENKGGNVVNLVGRESNKGKSQIFLISDSHARTVKYIYCLAAGIPCVSSLWIGECLKQNSIVDWKPFELNSGWSLEEGAVIPAHQKKPLKGIRIYVTAESEELYNYWKPVLIAAQANLLKPMKSRKKPAIPTDTEVLVTDATCTAEMLDMAHNRDIPVVKPEWLVQTIITGQKAEYSGHEKYQVGMSDADMGDDDAEEEEGDH